MFRPLTRPQMIADLAIAVVFALMFGLLTLHDGTISGSWAALVLLAAALAVRRWAPGLALLGAWAGAVAQMLTLGTPGLQTAAIPAIVYACAAYGTPKVRWTAFTSSLVGGAVAGVYLARSGFLSAVQGDLGALPIAARDFAQAGALTAATLLLAWTLGLLVATARRSQHNRREADEAGRQVAAEQERTRIARDMHDVVAHSLAVVIAQSDGARLLRRTDPESVDEALETIGAVSRAALADVRVLLQQLRYEGTTSAQPGLADLDVLVGQFRGSGLGVDLSRDDGLDRLGTATQLAAYRIVQESLTNALRHGDLTRPASVVLARTPGGLEVEVGNGIDAARPPRPSTSGHGLIGMRERASAVQGELRAGPDGDRFTVRASLPATATAAVPVIQQVGGAG